MRYLVLSDIHANLHALRAVLADADRRAYDRVLVLGDIVGYGACPVETLDETLAVSPAAMIRGNHDKVCCGLEPPLGFSPDARLSAEWTSRQLDPGRNGALRRLPRGPVTVAPGLVICHGAPFDEDHYIFGEADARRAMRALPFRLCLCGHTHVPAAHASADVLAFSDDGVLRLPEGGQVVANVGSVGQPRDGDCRAAYGILDETARTLAFRRVEYDVDGAQAAIRDAGLPEWLADRLAIGR
jgi:diadenosine tetraphosphatase ApaH/serine/threonine PP2A family protein phosphatase